MNTTTATVILAVLLCPFAHANPAPAQDAKASQSPAYELALRHVTQRHQFGRHPSRIEPQREADRERRLIGRQIGAIGVVHLLDRLFLLLARDLRDAPVLTHLVVDEVLVDGC